MHSPEGWAANIKLGSGCEQKLKTNAQKIVYLLNNAVHLADKVRERRKKCDVQRESKTKPDRFIAYFTLFVNTLLFPVSCLCNQYTRVVLPPETLDMPLEIQRSPALSNIFFPSMLG